MNYWPALESLIRFDRSISELRQGLRGEPGIGCEETLATLSKQDACHVLRRFIEGELTKDDLHQWAEMLECREDVEAEIALNDLIFELATPEIHLPLTPQRAAELLAEMGE